MTNRFLNTVVELVTLSITTFQRTRKTEPLRPAPSMYDAVQAVRKGNNYEEVVQDHISRRA